MVCENVMFYIVTARERMHRLTLFLLQHIIYIYYLQHKSHKPSLTESSMIVLAVKKIASIISNWFYPQTELIFLVLLGDKTFPPV